MIYLDNAATTAIKPKMVYDEVLKCMKKYGGNPGRSDHKLSLAAAEKIYECRCALASAFGSDKPENIVFTLNATYALNIAIKSYASSGAHILISDLEHNSVYRVVCELEKRKTATYSVFSSHMGDAEKIIAELENAVRDDTKMLVCTHSSNICGVSMPIKKIGEFCKKHNLIFIVDGAQSAGGIPVSVTDMKIDAFCAPSHKGLYGPQGAGFIIYGDKSPPYTLIEGGNGINSLEKNMPDFLPERYEAGTLSTPSIAGLCASVKWVFGEGREKIAREKELAKMCAERLCELRGVSVIANSYHDNGIVLFTHDSVSPTKISGLLSDDGVCVRAGYHCSPLAHKTLGTYERGGVRVSFGAFNTKSEIDRFLISLERKIKQGYD